MDVQARAADGFPLAVGTSVPGSVSHVPGGVARNIAAALAALRPPRAPPPLLVSCVGNDAPGDALVAGLAAAGLPTHGVRVVHGGTTPTVTALFDPTGDLGCCVADVRLLTAGLDAAWISRFTPQLRTASVVLVDGNLKEELMRQVCALAAEGGAPVWFEPVSVAKAIQGVPFLSHFHWVSPNEDELLAMAAALSAHHHQGPSTTTLARGDDEPPGVRTHSPDAHAAVAAAAEALLDAGVACVVTTRGARGALLSTRRACSGDRGYGYTHRALAALPATVLNVSGAGDSLVAGTLAALLAGHAPEAAVAVGMVAAKHAVQAAGNAPEGLEWAAAEEEARTVVTSDW